MGCSVGRSEHNHRSTVQVKSKSLKPHHDYLLKLLLIGDSSVGKSSLLLRLVDNIFSEAYISTIGVDFKIRTMQVDGVPMKLQIWDTAGEERFRTITSSYYRGAHGVIMVYDITNPGSFASIPRWLEEVDKYAQENVVKLLVGNKSDQEADRQVTKEESELFARENALMWTETSAKHAVNVEEAFMLLVREIKELL